MKNIFLFLGIMLLITACEDLDQIPPKDAEASSLTKFGEVLNAAYYYQTGSATPLAIMGDFRADNCIFDESPHDAFNQFDNTLTTMEGDVFQPFYAALYKSILSANIVVENSENASEIAEAKFIRGLAYFKLVKVFGNIAVNLSDAPSTSDLTIFEQQPTEDVYSIIIADFKDAIEVLDNSQIADGRASKIAAQGLLGKVYMQMDDYSNAATQLKAVIDGAADAGISLQEKYADVFSADWNSEILFATRLSASVTPSDYTDDVFGVWYGGGNTKADELPVTADLIAAFDAQGDTVRRNFSIDLTTQYGTKYAGGSDQDWIELRLADVILLYAEALNETGSAASTVLPLLDDIRTRAGLASLTGTKTTKAEVKQAIADERRLELVFEGQRWFDLVRTNTVDAEMGQTINSNYYLFPIPDSETQATGGVIVQNPGY